MSAAPQEVGRCVWLYGPYPATDEQRAAMRDEAKPLLDEEYRLAAERQPLGEPSYLDGPFSLFGECDEGGDGIGEPMAGRARYAFGWLAPTTNEEST